MYIKRKLEGVILGYLDKPEILAIVGPRQSGKTTLLKKIQTDVTDAIFISFEDIEDLNLFEQDIKGFAKKYFSHKYIFIDEFQYAKQGGKKLKYLYDTFPHHKIIISGSSAIDLTIKAIKFLTGRVFVFQLYELDFEEYLSWRDPALFAVYRENAVHFNLQNLKNDEPNISAALGHQLQALTNEFIIWGGYPRVAIAASDEEKKTVLKNIYNTYFLRDIKDMLGLADDFKLAKLIEALAAQIGQLVNYNELGQISGYDYITLKKYLNILEKTFICQPVRPFFSNQRKEISKNPKIYFFDTGLRNYIVSNFNQLDKRGDKGQLYENFIFTQLLKQEFKINYWRNKNHAEVDFIINVDNQLIPIESKSLANKSTLPRSMVAFLKEYQPTHALILENEEFPADQHEKTLVHFLPRWFI